MHTFVRFDGTMNMTEREEVIEMFNSGDIAPWFILCSLKAARTGINLTSGSHAFMMEPWWNPSVENQASKLNTAVKLLTAPTARLKSPVRLGLAPPSKTGSLTQMTPNPNSNPTRAIPASLHKTLTHLTKSDPANQTWLLIWPYGQTSFI